MTYFFQVIAILLGSTLLTATQSPTSEIVSVKSEENNSLKENHNKRLLVKYKDKVPVTKREATNFSVGAYVVKTFAVPKNLEVVEVTSGIDINDAKDFYKNDPNVEYVEPDYPLKALIAPPPDDPESPPIDTPEEGTIDPRYEEQWGLNNTGQTGGLADADINGPEMWEHVTTNDDVVIAVIDTGVNYNHPDLKNNMWVNPAEIPGNGIDDDNNGVVDDIHGFNAIEKKGDPLDDNGHGSHCAGIIGAEKGNIHGGHGVMPNAKIIGCKFLDARGSGATSDAVACLNYLLELKTREENPVNIIATNNSWGGAQMSQALEDAIKAHQDAGILFVAAAGNSTANNDVVDTYPADYPMANVVSVAATDHNDDLADFSNYGRRTVHVGAPGKDILSTFLDNTYKTLSGTSMAAPYVTGLAGMIKHNDPTLNYTQIKNLLMAGGTEVEHLKGKTISGRRIRAKDDDGTGSLSCKDQVLSSRLSPAQNFIVVALGEVVTLSHININCQYPNGKILVPLWPKNLSLALKDNGLGLDSSAGDGVYTTEWIAEEPGRYEFEFPGNDRVVVNVYDPALMKKYVANEAEFYYREFEGTALKAKDDWSATISMPFSVAFGYEGNEFDILTIGSNGALSFTDTSPIPFSNESFPIEKSSSFIAPLWDDLNPSASSGDIYYGVMGEAPNREFIIEWRNVRHYSSENGASFQVVLFEGKSDVLFNYLDVDFGKNEVSYGASATVGIQSSSEHVEQISYNEAKLQNETSYKFTLIDQPSNPDDPVENPDDPVSDPGEEEGALFY